MIASVNAAAPLRRVVADRVCRWWIIVAAAWLALFAGLVALYRDSEAGSLFVGDIVYLVPLAAGATAALIAARRLTGRHRRFWLLLSIAWCAQLAGECVWAGYDYLSDSGAPQPSAADVGYLTSSVTMLAALMTGFGGVSALRRWRGLLDTAIIVLGVGAAVWCLAIRPQWSPQLGPADVVTLTYPVFDTAQLCCLLIIGAAGHSRIPLPVRLVGLSSAVNALSDLVYTCLSISTGYEPGGWLDVGFEAASVCGLVAALIAVRVPEPPAEPLTFDRGLALTPVLFSSAVVFTLLVTEKVRTGVVDDTTLTVSGMLFVGVLFRQHLFTRDRAALAEQLRQALLEQQRLAVTDSLTGLHNRRYFTEQLLAWPDREDLGPISVIVVDLDHFKRINDTYGHLNGDAVLRQSAELIVSACRPTDLVARWGGEEFVIMLPGTSGPEAEVIAERVRRTIATDPVPTGEGMVPVTASIGVATGDPRGGEALVESADKALYQAKRSGRNRVVMASVTADGSRAGGQTASATRLRPAPLAR
ncbi:GGDEF domain-containing protein [Actinoplanes sp. NPDC020271]|uniref:GGDEF domain-containing protein n=1 Tax=Actinoplanes sp. NPDC020271 TaxID=3363896 RepID=UPI0037ADAA8E